MSAAFCFLGLAGFVEGAIFFCRGKGQLVCEKEISAETVADLDDLAPLSHLFDVF